MRAIQVKIHRVSTGTREYDAITVVIGDLHLRCDANNDRAIRLARRLADAHAASFFYDDATKERVVKALEDLPIESEPFSIKRWLDDQGEDSSHINGRMAAALEKIASFPHAPDAYIVAREALDF
ncbi:MAG: hypothetical protein ACRCV9_13510 [Burkholderiaceae bacterium]